MSDALAKAWGFLEISKRWRCPKCARELIEVNEAYSAAEKRREESNFAGSNPSPDAINARHPEPVYRCRACRVSMGLSWYRGTSCPVCADPNCIAFCDREWADAYASNEADV